MFQHVESGMQETASGILVDRIDIYSLVEQRPFPTLDKAFEYIVEGGRSFSHSLTDPLESALGLSVSGDGNSLALRLDDKVGHAPRTVAWHHDVIDSIGSGALNLIVYLENPPSFVDRGMVWLNIPDLGSPKLLIGFLSTFHHDQLTVGSLREIHRNVMDRMTTVIQDIMTPN